MKQLTCEMCGSTDLMKQDGVFVCQSCGCKYSVEEAKRMMIEGTVDVSGSTVKVDNSAFVQKYLANARRALEKEDWSEVEKYYNMVEQNAPSNMEAVFFSSFGQAVQSMVDGNFYLRRQKFEVLCRSISVINDYYEETNENKEEVLRKISKYVQKLPFITCTWNGNSYGVGSRRWNIEIQNNVRVAFLNELNQIRSVHDEAFIRELIQTNSTPFKMGGCYVATAVYGSYDCPQVWTLRRFRDYTLAESWYGRAFIYLYYAISPTLVKWFGHTKWFKKMWKGKLDRMVANLNAKGVENTPYDDVNW